MMRIRLAAIVVALFAIFGPSCSPVCKSRVSLSKGDTDRLAAFLKWTENVSPSFKGIGKLRIEERGATRQMRVAWIGARPGRLRLEGFGMWGQPTFLILLRDGDFFLHNAQDGRYFKGKSTAHNLARLLGVPVSGDGLITVLSGRPPILPFSRAELESSGDETGQRFILYGRRNRIVEKVSLSDDGTTAAQASFFDIWGRVDHTVTFTDFRYADDILFPFEIVIAQDKGPKAALKLERLWTGVPVSDDTFVSDFPDAEMTDLDT
jgi:hypothetical protein